MTMTQHEGNSIISDKLEQIATLYAECAKIAEESGCYFYYTGPAGYGDGGNYFPGEDSGWNASSQSC